MARLRRSGEDYLETILILSKRNDVRSVDVAREMELSKPSVSRAVGLLKSGGFITVDKNGYISLTEDGKKQAERIYERHTVLTEWLVSIGVDEGSAAENACRLEHDFSDEVFAKLKAEAKLPDVVFHSLRHSSATYKLKLNHGDLKATQGDTGHAEIDMITGIYAHILDEDRKVNAQKFETAFYAKPDLRNVRPPEEPAKSEPATLDLESLVEQLQKSPELASALAALIAAQAPAK